MSTHTIQTADGSAPAYHVKIDLVDALIWAMVFRAAIRMGIFTFLSENQGALAEETSHHLSLDPHGTRILLTALAHIGLLQKEGPQYRNSSYAEAYFVKGKGGLNYLGEDIEDQHKNASLIWKLNRTRLTGHLDPEMAKNGTPRLGKGSDSRGQAFFVDIDIRDAPTWAMFLLSALKIGLFNSLSENPDATAEFSEPDKPETLVLLKALSDVRLITEKRGRYCNSAFAESYLVMGRPNYRGEDLIENCPRFMALCGFENSVKTGITDYTVFHKGMSREARLRFTRVLDREARLAAPMLVNVLRSLCGEETFRERRLLDVGGGSGTYSVEMVRSFPGMSAVILEQADLVEILTGHDEFMTNKLGDRIKLCKGDFEKGEDFPKDSDIILLSRILHDWDERKVRVILDNCLRALRAGGLMIMHEEMLNDDMTGPYYPVVNSLYLLIQLPGENRTREWNKKMLEEAGFVDVRIGNVGEYFSVVTAMKPRESHSTER